MSSRAEAETARVLRRSEDHDARAAELRLEDGDTLTTPLLPDVELPLLETLAEG